MKHEKFLKVWGFLSVANIVTAPAFGVGVITGIVAFVLSYLLSGDTLSATVGIFNPLFNVLGIIILIDIYILKKRKSDKNIK